MVTPQRSQGAPRKTSWVAPPKQVWPEALVIFLMLTFPSLPQRVLPEVWLRHRRSLLIAFQLVTPRLRWQEALLKLQHKLTLTSHPHLLLPEGLMIFPKWPEALLEYLHYLTLTPNPNQPHFPLPEALMILPRWPKALDVPHHPYFPLPEALSIWMKNSPRWP